MQRRTLVGLLLVIAWGGAFATSFVVVEWRSPDAKQLERKIERLRAAVDALGGGAVLPIATVVPAAVPKRAPLTPGTEVALGLAHITMVGITTDLAPPFKPGEARAEFILEGPYEGGLAFDFKVVDQDGFLCDAGINAEVGTPLGPGEKTRVWIYYKCAGTARPATLSLDGVTFEFPP